MASLIPSTETTGRILRRVDFVYPLGRRHKIRLGRVTGQDADDFRRRLELIINDLRMRQPHSPVLTEWINGLSDDLYEKLHRTGLLRFARQQPKTLGEFLADYRRDSKVKGSTLKVYDKVIRNLCDHYGKNCVISTIGSAEAETFRSYLQSPAATERKKLLSTATINRRVTYAKQFFNAAKKKGHFVNSPFEDVVGGSQENAERLEFVEADI